MILLPLTEKKMNNSKFDVIIFGATGFTGKCVAEQCAKIRNVTWAIAGRSLDKMRELLDTVSLKTGIDVRHIEAIKADCGDAESLNRMAKKAKVVVNCTGPYRFFGESVVKACVEHGTHYVDVTGEPEFMERMQLAYHDLARANGCYVVSSCGMDSVPVDIGIIHFAKTFDGQVNYVETYMRTIIDSNHSGPFLNYTTWESAVHGFANQKELGTIRKKLFSQMRVIKPQPPIPRRPTIHRSKLCENKHCIPFPGSDRSVVVRTQMFLANEYNMRPIQCNAYLVCNSIFVLWGILLIGYFLQILTKYEFGRKLLLNYPQIFSLGMTKHTGPSEETLINTRSIIKLYGEGWSRETLKTCSEPKSISQPTDSYMLTQIELQNSAYGFTAMCVLQCALTIINETEKLPSKGGVYTPGMAFYHTNIIDTLAKHGAEFKILEKGRK